MGNKGPKLESKEESKKSSVPMPPATDGKVEVGAQAPKITGKSSRVAKISSAAKTATQNMADHMAKGNFDAEHAGKAIAEMFLWLMQLLAMLLKHLFSHLKKNTEDRQNQQSYNKMALDGYQDAEGNKVKGLRDQLKDKVDEYNKAIIPDEQAKLMEEAKALQTDIHAKERQDLRNDYKIKKNELKKKQAQAHLDYTNGKLPLVDYIKEHNKIKKELQQLKEQYYTQDLPALEARQEQERQNLANGKYDMQMSLGGDKPEAPKLSQEQQTKLSELDQNVEKAQKGFDEARAKFEEAHKAYGDKVKEARAKERELNDFKSGIEGDPDQAQQQRINELQGEVDSLKNERDQLKADREGPHKEMMAKNAELDHAKQMRTHMEAEFKAENKLEGFKAAHQKAHEVTQEAQTKYDNAEKFHQQTKLAVENQVEVVEKKQEELAKAREDIEQKNQKVLEQAKVVEEQQEKVDDLKANISGKEKDIKKLEKDIKKDEKQVEKNQKYLARQEEKLKNAPDEGDKNKEYYENKIKELKEGKDGKPGFDQLEKDLEDKKELLQEANNKLDELKENLGNENDNLKIAQDQLDSDNQELQQAIENEQKIDNELQGERANLRELQKVEQEAKKTLDNAGEKLEAAKKLEQEAKDKMDNAQETLDNLKANRPEREAPQIEGLEVEGLEEEVQPNEPQIEAPKNDGPQEYATKLESLKQTLEQQQRELDQRMNLKFGKPDQSDQLGTVQNQQKMARGSEREEATVSSVQQLTQSNILNEDSLANEEDNVLDPNDTPYENQFLEALDLAKPSNSITTQRDGELAKLEENSPREEMSKKYEQDLGSTVQMDSPKSNAPKFN